jgi:hypothetical protein
MAGYRPLRPGRPLHAVGMVPPSIREHSNHEDSMRTQEQITREYQDTLKKAKALWDELLACVKAKPADPEEPKYRDVTEADIGKEVEVSDYHDFSEVLKGTLGMISNDGNVYLKDGILYDYARIRITPDEIAAARKLQDGSSGCTITVVWG